MTMPNETTRPITCPYCGGTEFTEGAVPVDRQMQFVKTFADGRRPAGKPVLARMCDGCGNVQLYVVIRA